MVKVCLQRVCKEFKKKGKLAACHFSDFSYSHLRDPMMIIQSLASQMCENVEGFQDKLLDQLRRPHTIRNLKDAFRVYLQNPLDELDFKESSLVVINGLDESKPDIGVNQMKTKLSISCLIIFHIFRNV